MTLMHPHVLFFLPLAVVAWFLVYEGRTPRARMAYRPGASPRIAAPSSIRGSPERPRFFSSSPLRVPCGTRSRSTRRRSGRDTVFLVDVSRSMETPDVSGSSRLAAVKLALLDLLPDLAGDRVALVAFAGTSVPKCPLTTDYDFFRQSVELLDTSSTSRGGTLLGDALRAVKKDFAAPGRKLAVWVFTDGGDQESFPVEAAKDFGTAGIRLYIWGVGTLAGGQVPERGVSSALNEPLLRDVVAAVPDSAFYGSSSPLWGLPTEYRAHHQNLSVATSSRVIWDEGVLVAFVADPSRACRRYPDPAWRIQRKEEKMKRVIRYPAVVVILVAALAAVPLSGCAGKAAAEWKTPADEAELAKLEAATLQKGLSRERRAQLFFLWGQELAEKDSDRAIGAFERVVEPRLDSR